MHLERVIDNYLFKRVDPNHREQKFMEIGRETDKVIIHRRGTPFLYGNRITVLHLGEGGSETRTRSLPFIKVN